MLSKSNDAVLRDILCQCDLAARFVEGLSCEAFCADMRAVYAVTRCLEIISEASRRLPDEIKDRHKELPWKQIAGAGNVYRHDYEDVAAIMYGTPFKRICRS
jgi:uncharacterized protein with HEPN domain